MDTPLLKRLEKWVVALLAAAFALPLAAAWVTQIPAVQIRTPAWLLNRTLYGKMTAPEPPVALTRVSVLSGKYQTAAASDFDTHFVGREGLIRVADEIYLRVFRSSPTGVLVGPHFSLVEPLYAQEYCFMRGKKETLEPLVGDMRRMQDFCDARGTAFAVVITPSKAAIYPENLPGRWLRRHRPEPRYYDEFIALLQEKGVRYVDGHRLTAELKASARVPVFPLGGIHWGDPAALATANALLETFGRQGLAVKPMTEASTEISRRPQSADRDLVQLINIILPWR